MISFLQSELNSEHSLYSGKSPYCLLKLCGTYSPVAFKEFTYSASLGCKISDFIINSFLVWTFQLAEGRANSKELLVEHMSFHLNQLPHRVY